MTTLKVADLSGRLLDVAVAMALGYPVYACGTETWPGNAAVYQEAFNHPVITIGLTGEVRMENRAHSEDYSPSTDWDFGGPLAQKHQIGVVRCNDLYFPKGNEKGDYYEPYWKALAEGDRFYAYGPTQLIAIMRCLVADLLGPEVSFDPSIVELLNKQG